MSGTQSAGQGKLGKYELRGTLGRGAMGTVYDGWDPAIDRRVAIKTVRLADADDEETAEALARFKREAQAAGRLSHPNIVGVYDYGETDQLAYIVMEFVEGRSLKTVIDQQKRLPPVEAVEVMRQVLAGLAYSHARGVIHRDIKPANMMMTGDGQVKIADFGIARIESSSMTSVGTVMGTPAYMPPEQFLGEPVDARSDIYAAGVMLFHLLTGERPYEGSMTSIMHRVLNAEAPPRASSRIGAPAAFDGVIAKAMARAPADRFANAGAFSAALTEALTAPAPPAGHDDEDATMVARAPAVKPATIAPVRVTPVTPGKPDLPESKPGRSGPNLPLYGAGAAALLLAAGGAVWLLRPGPGTPPAAAIPSSPVVTPAAPLPSATEPPAKPVPAITRPEPPAPAAQKPVLPAIEAALAAQPCASLRVLAAGGGFAVSGLVGSGDAERAVRQAATDAAAGARLSWSVLAVPVSYCAALEILGPSADPAMSVTIDGAPGRTVLRDKARIAPRVTLPGYPAWLSVDYLSNDGSQAHLYPNWKRPVHAQKPGSAVALTGRESDGVGPPFGRDLVLAIASSERLFQQPRPDTETAVQYLSALRQAVADARRNGAKIAAAAIVVDTEPAN